MTEPTPRAVPTKFVGISAAAPDVVFFLDDGGNVWALFRSPQGIWTWRSISIPPAIDPYEGQMQAQEQWKPFGAPPT